MLVPVPLERLDHFLVVGAEVGGTVVGDDRDLVLGQEPLLNELHRGFNAPDGPDLAACPEHQQEDALVLRRQRFAERLAEGERRVVGPAGRGRQGLEREVDDLLRNAVLGDGEIFRLQAGDRLADAIHHS